MFRGNTMRKLYSIFYKLFTVIIYLWVCKLLIFRLSVIDYFHKYIHIFSKINRYDLLINIALILLIPYMYLLNVKFFDGYSIKKTVIVLIPFIIILYIQCFLLFNM